MVDLIATDARHRDMLAIRDCTLDLAFGVMGRRIRVRPDRDRGKGRTAMVDLIATDARHRDMLAIRDCTLDLAFGEDENDFQLTVHEPDASLEAGAFVYVDGTEYGGIIDSTGSSLDDGVPTVAENDFQLTVHEPDASLEAGAFVYVDGTEYGGIIDSTGSSLDDGVPTVAYEGRTWHGLLASRIIQPPSGQDYRTVSGDATDCIQQVIDHIGLSPTRGAPGTGCSPAASSNRRPARITGRYPGTRPTASSRSSTISAWAR